MQTLQITDGTDTLDMVSGTDTILARDGWAPAVRVDRQAGLSINGPYGWIDEKITFICYGATADATAARVEARVTEATNLFDNAARWWHGDTATASVLQALPTDTDWDAAGGSDLIPIPGRLPVTTDPAWNDKLSRYESNITIEFRRVGSYLQAIDTATSSTNTYPGILTATLSAAETFPSPTSIKVIASSYQTATGSEKAAPRWGTLIIGDAPVGDWHFVEAEAAAEGTDAVWSTVTDTTYIASDDTVMRFDASVATSDYIETTAPAADSQLYESYLVAVMARNNDTTNSCRVWAASRRGNTINAGRKVFLDPGSVDLTCALFLGPVSQRTGIHDAIRIYVESDTASGTVDIDWVWIVPYTETTFAFHDPTTGYQGFDGLQPIEHIWQPGAMTGASANRPFPVNYWTQTGSASKQGGIMWAGDPNIMTKARAISAVAVGSKHAALQWGMVGTDDVAATLQLVVARQGAHPRLG